MRECLFQLHCTKHLDPLKTKYIPQCQHSTQPIPPTGRQRAPAPPPFSQCRTSFPPPFPPSYIHVLSVYLKRNEPRAAHPKKAGNHPVCPINPSAPCSHLAPRNSTNQLTRFPVFQPSKWYTVSRAYSTPRAEENTSHTHCGRARLTPYYRPSCLPTGIRYGTGVVWLSVRPHSAASDHHHHHCLSPIPPARNTTRSTVSRRAGAILRRLVGLQGECILIGWSVFLLSDRFRWW